MLRWHGAGVALAALVATAQPAAAGGFKPKDLIDVRDKALKILENNDMRTAVKKLGNPKNGALDLEGPGLHTWAFKGKGGHSLGPFGPGP